MTIFLTAVHVMVCIFLIAVILLQAGRGGGLADVAATNQMQNVLGSQSNTILTRITEVCAIIFVITSVSLGILATQKNKSLIDKNRGLVNLKPPVSVPVVPPQPAKEAAATATETAAPEKK